MYSVLNYQTTVHCGIHMHIIMHETNPIQVQVAIEPHSTVGVELKQTVLEIQRKHF